MRSFSKFILTGFALIVLSSPAWARKDSMTLDIDHPVMVGSTQIPAGEYQLKADEDKTDLVVTKDGKVVADVQGKWIHLPKKADDDTVQYNTNKLAEVDFGGTAQAFQVN